MRAFLAILGFVAFGLILFAIIGDALVDENRLSSLGRWDWLVAVGLMIADVAVPIPATLVITVMGQKHGPLLGGLIGTAGSFSAGVIAYGLTRLLGRGFARWLLRDDLEKAHRFFDNNGAFAVACSRWLPLLPEAISCMAGLTRMHFGRYCVALLCGAVPMCFAYAALATVSESKIVPRLISIALPVPIWWLAGRLLYRRTSTRRIGDDQCPSVDFQINADKMN